MDGMFSIQVLSRALETWGLQVVSLESEEGRPYKAAPATAPAFICNLQEHWFTLRRVAGGEWWNFNSLFPAPQPLSGFYLQAFLDTLRGEGWTIFVVVGSLPSPQPGSLESGSGGRWWGAEEARAATEEAERTRKRGRLNAALEGVLDAAARAGGALTLRSRGAGASGRAAAGSAAAGGGGGGDDGDDDDGDGDDDDADLAAAIAASLEHAAGRPQGQGALPAAAAAAAQGQGQGRAGTAAAAGVYGGGGGGGGEDLYEDDDPELAAAIAASLADSGPAAAAAGGGGGGGAHGGGSGAAAGPGPEPGSAPAGSQAAATQAEAEAEEEPLGPEPEEGEGVIEIAFRLPSGSRASRRFALSAPSTHLHAFLAPLLGLPPARVALFTSFPKKELPRLPPAPLSALGLGSRTLLLAEPRHSG